MLDKKKYVINIKSLKQALNLGLVLKKCIEPLNSIKPYIDMNADLRKTRNIDFRKDFFKVGEQCSF